MYSALKNKRPHDSSPAITETTFAIQFDFDECYESLLNQGYANLGLLDSQSVIEYSNIFNSLQFFEDVNPQYHFLETPASTAKTGRFFANPLSLCKNSNLMNLPRSADLVKLLYKYFGVPPLLYQLNAWKSVPIESQDPAAILSINSLNSRLPHIDFAALKFLKLFLFLDPVSKSDGPFHFWPGSYNHDCKYTYDGRYDYAEISRIFGNPITFTSTKPGSIFIADTSMYHCDGIVNQSGFRRVIQYEFCLPFIRLGSPTRLKIQL